MKARASLGVRRGETARLSHIQLAAGALPVRAEAHLPFRARSGGTAGGSAKDTWSRLTHIQRAEAHLPFRARSGGTAGGSAKDTWSRLTHIQRAEAHLPFRARSVGKRWVREA